MSLNELLCSQLPLVLKQTQHQLRKQKRRLVQRRRIRVYTLYSLAIRDLDIYITVRDLSMWYNIPTICHRDFEGRDTASSWDM